MGVASGIPTDLASIAGDGRASSEPDACAAFAVGGVTPSCVLRPSTPEQVAELLRSAADRGLGVIPCGNGTKLGIGAPPSRYDAALCLRDLNRITYYEPDDLVISVEPGMTFGALQQMLAERRLWLPLDPAGGGRATIGGILAANSAGPLRLRYGGPRDMVLGMKTATAEGKIIKTGGRVVKNVAGYDLAKLLIGSYGTLGVIVEATFKLYPRVATRTTWAIEVECLAAASKFRRSLLTSPLRPLRAVLLNAAAQAGIESSSEEIDNPQAAIWIEAGGSERVIARYESETSALAAQVNAKMRRVESAEAEKIWARIADFGNWMHRECRVPLVLRSALPIAAAEQFLERAGRDTQAEGSDGMGIAQLGVGVVELGVGAQTPNPQPPTPSAVKVEQLRRLAADLGGSLVVTHCPAELKSKIDVWGPPSDDFHVMRKLKEAWDPKFVLAPGRMIG